MTSITAPVWSNRDFWAVHAVLVAVGAVPLFGARDVRPHAGRRARDRGRTVRVPAH